MNHFYGHCDFSIVSFELVRLFFGGIPVWSPPCWQYLQVTTRKRHQMAVPPPRSPRTEMIPRHWRNSEPIGKDWEKLMRLTNWENGKLGNLGKLMVNLHPHPMDIYDLDMIEIVHLHPNISSTFAVFFPSLNVGFSCCQSAIYPMSG